MSNVMMNNNCQEYCFSVVSLPPRCNKPFHFCSDTRNVPSNQLLKQGWFYMIRFVWPILFNSGQVVVLVSNDQTGVSDF